MTEDPTTDSTPAWFTPPEHGASAPPRRPPAQAPPSPPAAPAEGFHLTGPAPADGFHLTRPAPADGFHLTEPVTAQGSHVTAPSAVEGFHVTKPGDTFAVTPPNSGGRPSAGSSIDFWPVGAPGGEAAAAPPAEEPASHRAPLSPLTSAPPPSATALAPPTPLVRPIITITPASSPSSGAEPSAPRRVEPEPEDDGGRGWRIRAGHNPSPGDEPARPTGILLDPQMAAEEPAAFVMPRMSWEKTQRQRPTRRYVLFGAGLLALSGLAALALTTVGGFAHGIHQPQTIGGLAQVDTPSVQTTLNSLDTYERAAGASNVVTGAYGTQEQTQMMLVVVQGSMLANGGTPAALQSFVHGIVTGASSVGWTLDPSKITTTTLDGTTFECDEGPASANGGAILSMCAWTDPGDAGAVVDITGQPLTDVLNETVQARAASEH